MMSERKHPEARCEDCTLSDRPYVPTYEPRIKQYDVLWVAQAPGDTEQYTQVPLTGKSGKQHISLCKMAGLNKSLMSHTNVCQCYPGRGRDGRDIAPMLSEVNCCKGRLRDDILKLKPKLIIALGEPAMATLTGMRGGIKKHNGRFLDLLPEFGYECKVLCILHPSYVMGQRQWIPIVVNVYESIKKFFSGEVEEDMDPVLILDPSPEELVEYLSETDTVYGTDLETTGLNPRRDTIIGCSFAKDMESAVAVDYAGPDDLRRPIIKAFLEDPIKKKCWQNGSFDVSFLRSHEIKDEGFTFDTRLAQQLINSDLPSDLDFLRSQETNIPPYKPPKKEMKKIAKWDKLLRLEYAALDAITTKVVMHSQLEKLLPQQLELMHSLLIPLVEAINEMQNKGVLVNVETLAALYVQCAPRTDEINQIFAGHSVNPRSNTQLPKFFNLKNTQEKTLEAQIKREHPMSELMELLLEYRKLYNLQSKYLQGIYNRLEEGRIHTTLKIEGTGTGRLSSENPNLQNVPPEMRAIYIPDPNCVWITADYSQIELWVMAIIADEDTMLKDLQDGIDIHYIACQLCFPYVKLIHGKRSLDYTYRQGIIAKAVVFGTGYGRTAWSIAREFNVTVAEAQQWQLKLIHRYPKLGRYKQDCETAYNRTGYLTTPFGRTRYLTTVQQGYNFPVQSSANEVCLHAVVKAHQAGLDGRLSVHDEILYNVPLAREEKELIEIKRVMERPVSELKGVSFPVSYKRGFDWYNLKEVV